MERGRETKGRKGEVEREIAGLKKKPGMLSSKLGISSQALMSRMTKLPFRTKYYLQA